MAVDHDDGWASVAFRRWKLPQLRRQMACDRLLGRLYLLDDDWVVKGATALLARDIGVRGTIDIDIYRQAGTASAETGLRAAAHLDIGDWFRFEVGAPRSASGATRGCPPPGTVLHRLYGVGRLRRGRRRTRAPE